MPLMNRTTWIPNHQINGTITSNIGRVTQINTPAHFLRQNILTTDIDFYNRYEGLNLAYYQTAMNPRDFQLFVDYVGGENIGIREEDFEVYYPED